MNDVYDSEMMVIVRAETNRSGAKYSIIVLGKEIHKLEDPNPPTAISRLAYFKTARPTLYKHLEKMEKDAETICQELQISITLATD